VLVHAGESFNPPDMAPARSKNHRCVSWDTDATPCCDCGEAGPRGACQRHGVILLTTTVRFTGRAGTLTHLEHALSRGIRPARSLVERFTPESHPGNDCSHGTQLLVTELPVKLHMNMGFSPRLVALRHRATDLGQGRQRSRKPLRDLVPRTSLWPDKMMCPDAKFLASVWLQTFVGLFVPMRCFGAEHLEAATCHRGRQAPVCFCSGNGGVLQSASPLARGRPLH